MAKVTALLTSFEGRIGRGVFALTSLGLLVASVIAFAIVGLPVPELSLPRCRPFDIADPSPSCTGSPRVGLVFALPQLLAMLAFGFFFFVTYVKRWHDLGRSGWWAAGMSIFVLLANLGGGLFLTLALTMEPMLGRITIMPVLGTSIASLWLGVVQPLFFAGSLSENAFGPPDQTFGRFDIPGATNGPRSAPVPSRQHVIVRPQPGGAQRRPATLQFGRR
jgi:uncharacterized membrane protein YhaH (DUF805 family)